MAAQNSTVPSQPQATRAFHQIRYRDKLISNFKIDQKNGEISFDINNCSQYFRIQRKPFYDLCVLNFYNYHLQTMSVNLLSKSKRRSTKTKSSQISALTNCHSKIYSLNASHPNYAVLKMTPKLADKNVIIKAHIYLYNKHGAHLSLLSHIIATSLLMSVNKSASVTQSRLPKKQAIASKSASVEEFEFCLPAEIGDCNPDTVFLSKLKLKNMDNKFVVYSNGLICLENGFDSHPWCVGTGDHINSNHASAFCMQFVHLLVRSCKDSKFSHHIGNNITANILQKHSQCHLAICESNISYKTFLEFGVFDIELLDLTMMTEAEISESCIKRENVLFVFKVLLNVKQNDKICLEAQLSVCPVYLLSSL